MYLNSACSAVHAELLVYGTLKKKKDCSNTGNASERTIISTMDVGFACWH